MNRSFATKAFRPKPDIRGTRRCCSAGRQKRPTNTLRRVARPTEVSNTDDAVAGFGKKPFAVKFFA